MLLPSIRRLALADVGEDVLRQLARHGESLYVERKQQPPEPPRFGAAAASFANMLGGFVLLGIADDGRAVGWEKPAKLDLQSHLGELLRQQVDPLPPFIADTRQLDGKPIGVLRVFESADRPHIVRGTGAIYVRTSKGKDPVPVDDHETILAMARRGADAEQAARRRLAETPAVARVFQAPDSMYKREGEGTEIIARAAPLTVTPAVGEWALTRRAAERCSAVAGELVPQTRVSGLSFPRHEQRITFGRAVASDVVQEQPVGGQDRATVMVDSAGVFAAGIKREPTGDDPPLLDIRSVCDETLLPLAKALVGLLTDAEAIGRAAVDVWVRMGPGGQILGSHPGRVLAEEPLWVAREITIPADDDEVLDLTQQWHRELQREVGLERFEEEAAAEE